MIGFVNEGGAMITWCCCCDSISILLFSRYFSVSICCVILKGNFVVAGVVVVVVVVVVAEALIGAGAVACAGAGDDPGDVAGADVETNVDVIAAGDLRDSSCCGCGC